MGRSRSNLSIRLLLAVTCVLVVTVVVLVHRVMHDEQAALRGAAVTATSPAPPITELSAFDIERVRLAVGSNGPIPTFLELYRHHGKRYPTDLQALRSRPDDLAAGESWKGPYIGSDHLLLDPWGQRYRYRAPGLHNMGSYDLWSLGPDGVENSSDDIGNW
jgi:general secretion pathway protein G